MIGRPPRTITCVDTPFQNPDDGSLIEVEVTDSRHPLFGRRYALASVNRPRPGRAGRHVLVVYKDGKLLRLPLEATSLAPPWPAGAPSKLTVEAMREVIALLAEDSGAPSCSSGPSTCGSTRPERCDRSSSLTSPRFSQR